MVSQLAAYVAMHALGVERHMCSARTNQHAAEVAPPVPAPNSPLFPA